MPILAAVAWSSLAPALDLRVVTLLLTAAGGAWIAAIRLANDRAGSLRMVVVGAVLLRLVALIAPGPRLSDDVYRYLWEGEVILAGIDPYRAAPQDPLLEALRLQQAELYRRVNHTDVSAAYPPLVQACGTLAAAVAHGCHARPENVGVVALRILFTLCDLLVLVPLARMLERRGKPPALACVWGWSPLVSVEFAGSGHLDSLGILLFMVALARLDEPATEAARTALRSLRAAGATALLTAAGLVKYLPFVALPWAGRQRSSWWRVPLDVVVLGFLAFAPFLALDAGEHGSFDGLIEYGRRWESTSLVYRWVEAVCDLLLEQTSTVEEPLRLARLLVASAWIVIAVVTWLRCRDPIRGSACLVGGFLVLSPTLHPWYLAWMVPFVALRPSPAWLWLVAAAPLAYWPLARWQQAAIWTEPAWLWPLLTLPFLALAAHAWLRGRQRIAPTRSTEGARPDESGP